MLRVYLANCLGFYKNSDIVEKFAKKLPSYNRKFEFSFYNPFPNSSTDPAEIAEKNKAEIRAADLIILFLDYGGADLDSGVAWEGGYAVGLREGEPVNHRKVIGITNSIRTTDVGNSVYNIQVMQNLDAVFGPEDFFDISVWINKNFIKLAAGC